MAKKFFLAKLRYVGSKRQCRAEGRVALSQTQQKNDDISCSFSSKAKFQIMHGAHAMHGA